MSDEEKQERLEKMLQPGKILRQDFGPQGIASGRLHIRAIVDEMVVFRRWSRKRRNWHYQVESSWWFYARIEHLTEVK